MPRKYSDFYYHWYTSCGTPGGTEWIDDNPDPYNALQCYTDKNGEVYWLDCKRNTVFQRESRRLTIAELPAFASELWQHYAGEDSRALKRDRRAFESFVGPGGRRVSREIRWSNSHDDDDDE